MESFQVLKATTKIRKNSSKKEFTLMNTNYTNIFSIVWELRTVSFFFCKYIVIYYFDEMNFSIDARNYYISQQSEETEPIKMYVGNFSLFNIVTSAPNHLDYSIKKNYTKILFTYLTFEFWTHLFEKRKYFIFHSCIKPCGSLAMNTFIVLLFVPVYVCFFLLSNKAFALHHHRN